MKINELKVPMESLVKAVQAAPWEDKKFYMQYLAQAYYYVSHSTRLLASAAGAADLKDQEFFRRCVKHISEESDHENIALVDFKKMGGDLKDYPELGVTRAFWETQYYKISKNPQSFLGYVLALEYKVVLCNKDLYKRICKVYGEDLCNFTRVHAEEDPGHVNEAMKQIKQLSEENKKAFWENYVQSVRMYTLFIEEIEHASGASLRRQTAA